MGRATSLYVGVALTVLGLAAALLSIGGMSTDEASAGPSPPTATVTPTPTSIRPAQYSLTLTANGQDGAIEVLPGTSVTFAWRLTPSIFFSMGGFVTNDTYPELDAYCGSSGPTTPCEQSHKVILSTLGTVTVNAHAKITKSCGLCPVTAKDDTVIVHVVTALSTATATPTATATATAASTATLTPTPTPNPTPDAVAGLAFDPPAQNSSGDFPWAVIAVAGAAALTMAAGVWQLRRTAHRQTARADTWGGPYYTPE